jgi:hypothetical protein
MAVSSSSVASSWCRNFLRVLAHAREPCRRPPRPSQRIGRPAASIVGRATRDPAGHATSLLLHSSTYS